MPIPGKICSGALLANLIHVNDLRDAHIIVTTFSRITNFTNVGDTDGFVSFRLDFLDGIGAVEGAVDFLEGGTAGFDKEEVYSNQLDEQPSFEEEVELPATGCYADRDNILRESQADVSRQALHKQTVGSDLEAENLQRVGHIEGDPRGTKVSDDRLTGMEEMLQSVTYQAKL